MAVRVWSKEDTYLLIENFELYPELWDIHSKDFKNRVKKQSAIKKLSELLDATENEIQRKLHNLRTQVNQEWRKIQKKKSGQGTDEVYKSSWKFFDAMKYIIDSSTPNSTEDNMTQRSEIPETETQQLVSEGECITQKQSKVMKSSKKATKRSVDHTEEDEVFAKAMKVMDRPTDSFQIFGDYVASELRDLRSQQLQKRLKRMIQRDILEIANLDDQEEYSTSRSTSTPLISPYETSNSNISNSSSQFHNLQTYHGPLEHPESQNNTPALSLQSYIREFDINTS